MKALTIVFALAMAGPGSPLTAQEAVPPDPTTLSVVSARLVESIAMPRHRWLPPDPQTQSGLLLTIRLPTHAAFSTEDFKVVYERPGGQATSVCRGYAMSMGWLIADEEGKGWKLFTGGKVADVPFLFVVPTDVGDVTLRLRDQQVGAPLAPVRETRPGGAGDVR